MCADLLLPGPHVPVVVVAASVAVVVVVVVVEVVAAVVVVALLHIADTAAHFDNLFEPVVRNTHTVVAAAPPHSFAGTAGTLALVPAHTFLTA